MTTAKAKSQTSLQASWNKIVLSHMSSPTTYRLQCTIRAPCLQLMLKPHLAFSNLKKRPPFRPNYTPTREISTGLNSLTRHVPQSYSHLSDKILKTTVSPSRTEPTLTLIISRDIRKTLYKRRKLATTALIQMKGRAYMKLHCLTQKEVSHYNTE